ncbi:N-succinylarginine dihydrolase [Motiliproteus coralliicola]|uniref:N-succinylarginine dihydrolase n=1 Tax=Motiliproteus coralliicola TaxID=2283196 RepID=A0A369W8B8_9GAMM|nr:N-succinylarginine dihydrolase [Motiliproteus coralliicola]RDE18240.1 N-succinylarginine dihydrolase [Motiliproteus coralliicola]
MKAFEANFDGLVGPTHNYAGLSFGNIASEGNQDRAANPKLAARQGLAKMKALHDRGFVQGVLAPQERPDIHTLRRIGFSGSDAQVLAQAAKKAPRILAACCSASSMWTANAATVSPSADAHDGRVHFTPANLTNKFHRSIEHNTTGRILAATFPSQRHFKHHPALPGVEHFGDEGAANHTRLCGSYGEQGIEFFVYGRHAFDETQPRPNRYPARQTLEASQAIVRSHQLNSAGVVLAQQNPSVIDQGVFHNDVIAVGNGNLLLCHEQAFLNQTEVKARLQRQFEIQTNGRRKLHIVEINSEQLSVDEAVRCYLFNSQLLSLDDERMLIVVPEECRDNPKVWSLLEQIKAADNPISEVVVFDLKQSMSNGGGPACLRLRVVLNEVELAATNQATLMSDALYARLNRWVDKHYRDRLLPADLADPQLLMESRTALNELTEILQLGSVYPFQR